MSYVCATCGETHDGLPDIGFKWPDPYFGVPESERDERIVSTSDVCSIDDEEFFIRGVLLIPVHDVEQRFGVGVWVTQSRENFQTYRDNFNSAEIGPFFGWLSNELPFYEESTWALQTNAHFQGNDQRPLIEPRPSDHPLYKDYSEGISLDRAWQMVHWDSGTSGT